MKQDQNNRWLQVGEYTSLAMLLPSCILAGYLLGTFLDHQFHTGYLKIVFLLLGMVAGMVQLIRQVMKDTRGAKRK